MSDSSEINPYQDPRLPDVRGGIRIKAGLADQAAQFIKDQRHGVESWPAIDEAMSVTTLRGADIYITPMFNKDDSDIGREVKFWMGGEHIATFYYGPPRMRLGFRLKRKLIKTQYHV